jgi:hypothetical protein
MIADYRRDPNARMALRVMAELSGRIDEFQHEVDIAVTHGGADPVQAAVQHGAWYARQCVELLNALDQPPVALPEYLTCALPGCPASPLPGDRFCPDHEADDLLHYVRSEDDARFPLPQPSAER